MYIYIDMHTNIYISTNIHAHMNMSMCIGGWVYVCAYNVLSYMF